MNFLKKSLLSDIKNVINSNKINYYKSKVTRIPSKGFAEKKIKLSLLLHRNVLYLKDKRNYIKNIKKYIYKAHRL